MIFTSIRKRVEVLHTSLFPWPHIQNNKGQSLIEFILTFSFSIGILFLLINIAINVTDGFMVHYATFMASRTYAIIESNSNKPDGSDKAAKKEAKRVIEKYINTTKGDFKDYSPEDVKNLPFVGIAFEYKKRFSAGLIGTNKEMKLKSESFIGREPTRQTCVGRICEAFKSVGGDCPAQLHYTLFDNGC